MSGASDYLRRFITGGGISFWRERKKGLSMELEDDNAYKAKDREVLRT